MTHHWLYKVYSNNTVDSKFKPMAATMSNTTQQNYDYFLVLDFEATCDDRTKLSPQEIIEFPVLKINGRTLQCESTFHSYVQPTANPVLTNFCTGLTGITQEMVTNQPTIDLVLKYFRNWLESERLLEENVRFIFVTCGDWDLGTMLPKQCQHFRLQREKYFDHWINIKKSFNQVTGQAGRTGMMEMLRDLRIPHQGRHHSGIDDCRNIAEILKDLIRRGHVFQENRR